MATVISLTKEKIQELLSGVEGVAFSQEELVALISYLAARQTGLTDALNEFQNETLPQLRQDLEANNNSVSALNETILPDLEQSLEENRLKVSDVADVILPNLQLDLESGIENSLLRPQTFISDVPPENTEDRDLIVGDIWHDTTNGNRQHRWDGEQWVTFVVDIPDLSVTVHKFKTSTHMLY